MKKEIRVKTNIECYSLYSFYKDFIAQLEEYKNDFISKYSVDEKYVEIYINADEEWGQPVVYIELSATRPETDEEYTQRLNREQREKDFAFIKEKEEYERLKAKFGDK